MEVIDIKDQKDGSCIVTLEMTEEENNILLGYAVNNILKEQLERMENEQGTDGD